jgi:hypothetical protein
MRVPPRSWVPLCCAVVLLGGRPALARAQTTGSAVAPLMQPGGYGSLTQDDLALRIRTTDLDIRFVPLDVRVTRLLAKDSWESLRSLVQSRRAAIDSVAERSGITRPGLALVTFFGQRADARFDPQTLLVLVRNREFRPLGIVPFSNRFTTQQLDVREQVSGIYLFEENLPVNDSFTIGYAGQASDDWQRKQPTLDRERARVALRARDSGRDAGQNVVSPDSAQAGTGDSGQDREVPADSSAVVPVTSAP